ncbi:MAG TPA: pyruvate dehydrogenase (acetyl-transferring) E1 component subunit alpha [Malonomonas sp.]
MPSQLIASFQINRLSILAPDGQVDESLMPELSDSQLLQIYELLCYTRMADQRALDLQREGRLGTYPSSLGQEAAQIGSGFALRAQDWIFPAFRELGVMLCHNYPLELIYRFWTGDERGQQTPEGVNIFPMCIAVGTHVLHAAGAALAAKYRGDDMVAAAFLGDGGTSKGDFHEALNMAGVYKLPLVVICQNNQWAISVPRQTQTGAETLAQKAIAHGIRGVQVDGNDVLAVYQATKEALDRARNGEGTTFIECETYRMSDHTTADDARRYRDPEEVKKWQERDPLLRMRRFLDQQGLWSDGDQAQLELTLKERLTRVVKAAESFAAPNPEEMFRSTCHQLSSRQQEQLKECLNGRT